MSYLLEGDAGSLVTPGFMARSIAGGWLGLPSNYYSGGTVRTINGMTALDFFDDDNNRVCIYVSDGICLILASSGDTSSEICDAVIDSVQFR